MERTNVHSAAHTQCTIPHTFAHLAAHIHASYMAQIIHHLRVTLGPTQELVALHPQKSPTKGLKRDVNGRSSAFQAALLRRQAMQVCACVHVCVCDDK